jgi:predicted nucleic acid-binding protein
MTSTADSFFIDTNIWLYALIATQDPSKHQVAATLIKQHEFITISVQVVNEVCVNLLRQTELGEAFIRDLLTTWRQAYTITPLLSEHLLSASELRASHHFSFWDSLIIASALDAGCRVLYSEDMKAGQTVLGQLHIVNPFS